MLRPAKDGSHSTRCEVFVWPPLGCWQANHNICHCVSVKKMKEIEVNYATKNITLNLPLLVVATTAFVLVCCDILVHWKHWEGLFLPWEHVGDISCWNCFLQGKIRRTLLVRKDPVWKVSHKGFDVFEINVIPVANTNFFSGIAKKVTFWFYNQFFKTPATVGTFISSKYHLDPSNYWSWNPIPGCTTGFSRPSHFLKVRQLICLHPSELVTGRWMDVLRAHGSVPSFSVWANQSASGTARTICTLILSWCLLVTLSYPTASFERDNTTNYAISCLSVSLTQ